MSCRSPAGASEESTSCAVGHGHCRFRITYCLSARANCKNSFMAGTSAAPAWAARFPGHRHLGNQQGAGWRIRRTGCQQALRRDWTLPVIVERFRLGPNETRGLGLKLPSSADLAIARQIAVDDLQSTLRGLGRHERLPNEPCETHRRRESHHPAPDSPAKRGAISGRSLRSDSLQGAGEQGGFEENQFHRLSVRKLRTGSQRGSAMR